LVILNKVEKVGVRLFPSTLESLGKGCQRLKHVDLQGLTGLDLEGLLQHLRVSFFRWNAFVAMILRSLLLTSVCDKSNAVSFDNSGKAVNTQPPTPLQLPRSKHVKSVIYQMIDLAVCRFCQIFS
jgi:hypothetical protein